MATTFLNNSLAPHNMSSAVTSNVMPAYLNDLVSRPEPEAMYPALHEGQNHAIHDMPQFASVPMVVASIVSGLLSNWREGLRDFLPEKQVNTLSVMATKLHFNRSVLNPVPNRGSFRLKTSKRSTQVANLERYGAGVEEDSDVFLTSEGSYMHELKLLQLVQATNNIQILQIMQALVNGGTINNSMSRAHGNMRDPIRYARIQADTVFSFQKNPENWTNTIDYAYNELYNGRQVPPPIGMIVPFDFVLKMKQRLRGSAEGYTPGDKVLTTGGIRGREPDLVMPNGVRVYSAPMMHEFDEENADMEIPNAFQILTRRIQIAEHVKAPGWLNVKRFHDGISPGGARYTSDCSDVCVYDTDNDCYHLITRKQWMLDMGGFTTRPYDKSVYNGLENPGQKRLHVNQNGSARLPFYFAWDENSNAPFCALQFHDLDSNVFSAEDALKAAATCNSSANGGLEGGLAGYTPADADLDQDAEYTNPFAGLAGGGGGGGDGGGGDGGGGDGDGDDTAPTAPSFLTRGRRAVRPATNTTTDRTGDGLENNSNHANFEDKLNNSTSQLKTLALQIGNLPITRKVVEALIDMDVWLPFEGLILWPRISFNADSSVMSHMGASTGNLLTAFPSVQQGNDPSNHSTLTTFSMYFHVLIVQYKNIITTQDWMCRGYIGGGGVIPYNFDTFPSEYARDYSDEPHNQPSIIVHILQRTDNVGDETSPAGFWGVRGTANGTKLYQYAAAHVAEKHLRLADGSVSFDPTAPFEYESVPTPIVSFRGLSACKPPRGSNLAISLAAGPRGPNAAYQGAGAVYRGAENFFIESKDIQQHVHNQIVDAALFDI